MQQLLLRREAERTAPQRGDAQASARPAESTPPLAATAAARAGAPAGGAALSAAPGVAAAATPVAKDTSAGAAARAAARAATGDEAVAAAPLRPVGTSPALTQLTGRVAGEARKQAAHPHAGGAVRNAQAAAVAPGAAARSAAASASVISLAAAPTAAFEAQAFKTALRAKLAQKMAPPASAEAAQKALESGTAQQVGVEMKAELGQHKDAATGGLPAAAANPASPTAFPQGQPPDMAPLPVAAAPSNPGGAGAVPAPLPPAALDTGADRVAADKQLAGEEINDQQLRKSNESQFTAASDARAAAEEHSSTGPAEVRQAEEGIRSNAQVQAGVLLGQGLAGIAGARVKGFGQVTGALGTTKEKDEAARIKISADLEAIHVKTRTQVEQFLKEMDDGATALFEKGLAEALAAFDAERIQLERAMRLKRSDEWSDFGVFGALMGYFWDLDKAQVEQAIAGAKAAYNRVVERVIDDVANLVGQKLAAARGAVIAGRAEAEKYVAGLSTGVKAIGEAALEKISTQFDTLAGDIDTRRDGLIDKLGEKYTEACREVDARAQAFRDANKSWWDRVKEAVRAVIQTLRELKALLISIATKAAAVARKILSDPIQFLKNLVTGVRMGLELFVSNILTHLKAGLFSWLFGTLSAAGIQLPERFDAKGIFGLIASVLGLTYANIRARAVLQLGEPMVARLEMVAEVFKVLITEGPMGLWHMLMEKLEALKEQVLGQIREMLMVQVIKAGVMWLIGLLNPASAFIKACKAIYDVVMFFIEKGKQIADFVNAVLDSLGAIASGQLGGVAKMVEGALAKAVPVVIGFLAGLLGLGGLSEKIKTIVAKIQAPVSKAIDWVIAKAVGLVNKVGGLFGGKSKEEPDNPEKTIKIHAGLAYLHAAEAKHLRDSVLEEKDAKAIAADTRKQHPVFATMKAHQKGRLWQYTYTASPESTVGGASAAEEAFSLGNIEIKDQAKWERLLKAANTSGREYELAVQTNVVTGPLREQMEEETGVPIDVTLEKSRKRSAEYLARMQIQRGHRTAKDSRTPDATVEFLGPGGRVTQVFIVEITLQRDFSKVARDFSGKMSHSKATQLFLTLEQMVDKYGSNVPIRYIYLCPGEPTPETKQMIVDRLKPPRMRNVTVVWTIVSGPK